MLSEWADNPIEVEPIRPVCGAWNLRLPLVGRPRLSEKEKKMYVMTREAIEAVMEERIRSARKRRRS